MTAKEEILNRIRNAKVASGSERLDAPVEESKRSREQIVEQFAEYAAEYRANVVRTSSSQVREVVEGLLRDRQSDRVVIPQDLPQEMRPTVASVVEDEGFDNLRLDQFQSVITACAVAIAETGTVVLDGGTGQGRRALTLIPDHHICLVYENQIVDSVPEAVKHLEAAVRDGQPLTWISGPSATSDIELNRVEGVHGPRALDIVLVFH
jgi:L-lactate dehydrogenase complex protein LldG